jgi:hypothetical protein
MDKMRVTALGPAILLTVFLASLSVASVVWAGSSDGPAVDWSVLSSGGAPAESSSGLVALNGTLGQTAIGPSAATHGSLGGGFWYGAGARRYEIYVPVVLRNS